MSKEFRPEDYGAKGDGVTDDSAAIQAAVNAAALHAALEREQRLVEMLTNTRDALTTCLAVLEGHFETLHRLAMHYPEAHHILSSPRKHSALVLLEQIIGRLDQQPASAPGRGTTGGADRVCDANHGCCKHRQGDHYVTFDGTAGCAVIDGYGDSYGPCECDGFTPARDDREPAPERGGERP